MINLWRKLEVLRESKYSDVDIKAALEQTNEEMKPVLDYKESFETVIPVFMVCSYSFSVYIYEVSIFMLIPYFFYQEVEDLPISDVQYES